MKITFEEPDENKAKRLIHADDVFDLLWDINSKLREWEKYETEKTKDEIIDELREMIWENNLLDLWQ